MPSYTDVPGRQTVYKGVRMRSRLEARYAAWLDRCHIPWTYEPAAFADQHGQYLPDFELHGVYQPVPSSRVFVEVKPNVEMARPVMRQMEVIWASEPEAVLVLELASPTRAWPAVRSPGLSQFMIGGWILDVDRQHPMLGMAPHRSWMDQ